MSYNLRQAKELLLKHNEPLPFHNKA